MRTVFRLAVAFFCLLACMPLFSQSNATLSGTVTDSANALMPGVTVTATNTATGVVSTAVTNETGTYNIQSLLPGTYTVSADLPGFQMRTFTDVRLGNTQVRLKFTLQVASVSTAIEVTARSTIVTFTTPGCSAKRSSSRASMRCSTRWSHLRSAPGHSPTPTAGSAP